MNPTPGAGPDYDSIRASDGAIKRLRALHPSLIDLSTDRINRVLRALGDPHNRMGPVIHVAGTNGKGSTTAFMRAMAEAAGLTVNVLTSPHLVRFAERIRIRGRLITDEELSQRIDEVEAANAGEPISFFEITTALAFHAFAESPADLNLIEVGLGGRFDASNVFAAPAVSVITPVGLDHLEFLGPELSKIAWEKAGIIKAGCPVVVGRQSEEALAVIETEAAALGAPLQLLGREFDAWSSHSRLAVQFEDGLLDLPAPALPGAHQYDNAAVAIAALRTWRDVDETAFARGVREVRWPGRFQRLAAGPLAGRAQARGADLWIDGAHNPHAAEPLARACAELRARDGRPLALIIGMLGRKDAEGFFRALGDLKASIWVTAFDSPTATPADDLAAAAARAGLSARVAQDVDAALEEALALGEPHVVIAGSLHFIGEVLARDPVTWPD